jgi:hypothetical protein
MSNSANQTKFQNASNYCSLDPKSLVTSFQGFRVYKKIPLGSFFLQTAVLNLYPPVKAGLPSGVFRKSLPIKINLRYLHIEFVLSRIENFNCIRAHNKTHTIFHKLLEFNPMRQLNNLHKVLKPIASLGF